MHRDLNFGLYKVNVLYYYMEVFLMNKKIILSLFLLTSIASTQALSWADIASMAGSCRYALFGSTRKKVAWGTGLTLWVIKKVHDKYWKAFLFKAIVEVAGRGLMDDAPFSNKVSKEMVNLVRRRSEGFKPEMFAEEGIKPEMFAEEGIMKFVVEKDGQKTTYSFDLSNLQKTLVQELLLTQDNEDAAIERAVKKTVLITYE